MKSSHVMLMSVVLLVVVFVAGNMLADRSLRAARVDLTQNRLYTLSPGTRNILASIDEPVKLTLFYSQGMAAGVPTLQMHGKRVRELLEEYRLHSKGKVTLEVVDPEPFSEAEERAQAAGLAGASMGTEGVFFLGVQGVNSTDGREIVPFFDPRDERFVEYELSKLVYNLSNPEKKKVGVISSLPLDGGPGMPGSRPAPPWQIMRELRTLFDVQMLDPSLTEVPKDVGVLLVVHPKNLEEPVLRAIDSFVIAGGRAVIFTDPVCEADVPPGADQNPLAAMQADRSSSLNTLLEAWGLRMEEGQVAADIGTALRGRGPQGGEVPYVQYLGLTRDEVDGQDAVTRRLSSLRVALAGSLTHDASKGTLWTPLVRTSSESMLLEASKVSFFPQPQELVASYAPRGDALVIAGRLSGEASSAFPPPAPEGGEAGPPAPDAASSQGPTGEINVIVVADVDMLADQWWVQEVSLGDVTLGYQKLSENGDFLVNAVDNMVGSSDLIAIRARGQFTRDFTLVSEIQAEAERKYLAEAEALQAKQRDAEQRISQLQRARPDQGEMIFTPEQQAEIEKFREELASTKRQLREVNFNLRRDVERLGFKVKAINIAAAPLAVLAGALALAGVRAARRRAARADGAGRA